MGQRVTDQGADTFAQLHPRSAVAEPSAGTTGGELRGLWVALASYVAVFSMKLAVFMVSGITVMLAEALHTLSDILSPRSSSSPRFGRGVVPIRPTLSAMGARNTSPLSSRQLLKPRRTKASSWLEPLSEIRGRDLLVNSPSLSSPPRYTHQFHGASPFWRASRVFGTRCTTEASHA